MPRKPGPIRDAVPPTAMKLGRSRSFGVNCWAATEPMCGHCVSGLGDRPVFKSTVPR